MLRQQKLREARANWLLGTVSRATPVAFAKRENSDDLLVFGHRVVEMPPNMKRPLDSEEGNSVQEF